MVVSSSEDYDYSLSGAWKAQKDIFEAEVVDINFNETKGQLPGCIKVMEVALGKLDGIRAQSLEQLEARKKQCSTRFSKCMNRFVVPVNSVLGFGVSALYVACVISSGMSSQDGDGFLNSTSDASIFLGENGKDSLYDSSSVRILCVSLGALASYLRFYVQKVNLRVTEEELCLTSATLGEDTIEDCKIMLNIMRSLHRVSLGDDMKLGCLRRSIPTSFKRGDDPSSLIGRLSRGTSLSSIRYIANVVVPVTEEKYKQPEASPASISFKDIEQRASSVRVDLKDSGCSHSQDKLGKYYGRSCLGISVKMNKLVKNIECINQLFMSSIQSTQSVMGNSNPIDTNLKMFTIVLEKKHEKLTQLYSIVNYIKCQLSNRSQRKVPIVSASIVQVVGELAALSTTVVGALQGVTSPLNYVGAVSLVIAKVSAAVSSFTSVRLIKREKLEIDIAKIESGDSRAMFNFLLGVVEEYQHLCESLGTGISYPERERIIRNLLIPPDVLRRWGDLFPEVVLNPLFFQQCAVRSNDLSRDVEVVNQGVPDTGWALELEGDDSDEEDIVRCLRGARGFVRNQGCGSFQGGGSEQSLSSSVMHSTPESSERSPPLPSAVPRRQSKRSPAPKQSSAASGGAFGELHVNVGVGPAHQIPEIGETFSEDNVGSQNTLNVKKLCPVD